MPRRCQDSATGVCVAGRRAAGAVGHLQRRGAPAAPLHAAPRHCGGTRVTGSPGHRRGWRSTTCPPRARAGRRWRAAAPGCHCGRHQGERRKCQQSPVNHGFLLGSSVVSCEDRSQTTTLRMARRGVSMTCTPRTPRWPTADIRLAKTGYAWRGSVLQLHGAPPPELTTCQRTRPGNGPRRRTR